MTHLWFCLWSRENRHHRFSQCPQSAAILHHQWLPLSSPRCSDTPWTHGGQSSKPASVTVKLRVINGRQTKVLLILCWYPFVAGLYIALDYCIRKANDKHWKSWMSKHIASNQALLLQKFPFWSNRDQKLTQGVNLVLWLTSSAEHSPVRDYSLEGGHGLGGAVTKPIDFLPTSKLNQQWGHCVEGAWRKHCSYEANL